MVEKNSKKRHYKVIKFRRDEQIEFVRFPLKLKRNTKSKPSIDFSENPQTLRWILESAEQTKREKKKLQRKLNEQSSKKPVKVKIFLECPEEIEEFETGIVCEMKEKAEEKEEIHENEVKIELKAPENSENMENQLVSYTSPMAKRRRETCTPVKTLQSNKVPLSPLMSLRFAPPSPSFFPSPYQYRHTTPMKTRASPQFYRSTTPPPVRRFDRMDMQRSCSAGLGPPPPRHPPNPFRFPHHPGPSRFYESPTPNFHPHRSPGYNHNLPLQNHHRSDNRQHSWGNSSSPAQNFRSPQQNFRSSSPNFQNFTPNRNFSPQFHSRNSPRPHQRCPGIRIARNNFQTPPKPSNLHQKSLRHENLQEIKKNFDRLLQNSRTLTQEADSTTAEDDSRVQKMSKEVKARISSGSGVVSSSGIPFINSPVDSTNRNSVPAIKSKKMLEDLEKKTKRKLKRETKRIEKATRKNKLREEIRKYEDAGVKLEAWEMKKKISSDEQLQNLKKINIFDIIGVKNQAVSEPVQLTNKKKRAKRREKKEIVAARIMAAAEKSLEELKLLPTPAPPAAKPLKHLKQPTLKDTPEDLFAELPVNLKPMKWENHKKETGNVKLL